MATKTIYKCDRCGSKQETQEQFWNLAIAFRAYPAKPDIQYSSNTELFAEWCRGCMEELRLLPLVQRKVENLPEPPRPTLEQRVLAIIGELIDTKIDERGL